MALLETGLTNNVTFKFVLTFFAFHMELFLRLHLIVLSTMFFDFNSWLYVPFNSLHPLFPGSNEVDQIAKIHDVLGTPSPNILKKLQKLVVFSDN